MPLPGYVFDCQRCWPEPVDSPALGTDTTPADTKLPPDQWFWLPSWRRTLAPAPSAEPARWLVLHGADDASRELVAALERRGDTVDILTREQVRAAPEGGCEGLRAALGELAERGRFPERIVSLWPLSAPTDDIGVPTATAETFDLARALTMHGGADPLHVWVVTQDAVQVDAENVYPESATLLGPCLVLSQENPHITCRVLDIRTDSPQALARRVLGECAAARPDDASIVAWRGTRRWVPNYEQVEVPAAREGGSRLRSGGVYLVTGGLGRIGLELAERLAALPATVILTTRGEVPPGDGADGHPDWAALAESQAQTDERRELFARLRDLEAAGGRVLLDRLDMADADDVERALHAAVRRFGRLDGVFHAAGLAELAYLPQLSGELVEREFAPKVAGLRHLDRSIGRLAERGLAAPEFVVLFSSIAGVLGGLAMGAYMAANRFMDTFAAADPRRHGVDWIVIDWDDWDFDYAGEQIEAYTAAGVDRFAMSAQEGVAALDRVLALGGPANLLVSTRPLPPRLQKWVAQHVGDPDADGSGSDASGAPADTDFPDTPDSPGTDLERRLTAIYAKVLGVPQIGLDDNFFDLGGDSLLAAQILSQLRRTLAVDGRVQLGDVFGHPSVSALAGHIESVR